MRVLIVDDEPNGIISLKNMLAQTYGQAQVIDSCSTPDEGIHKMEALHPDLVFLNLHMAGKSGPEMLAELDQVNFEVIFTTDHEQELQTSPFGMADYLLKPVDETRLTELMYRVQKKLEQKEEQPDSNPIEVVQTVNPNEMRLCVPTLKGFILLKLDDIVFCEARKNYTIIHTLDNKPLIASRPLLEYEKILERTTFLRVHRTFIINLHHVSEYHRGEGGIAIMTNKAEIEISRRKKERFLNKIREVFFC